MKRLFLAIFCLLVAIHASAAPILGLVDGATGEEIPDADARYALAGATGLTTNDSPTMAAGTDWIFALGSITNTATSGTDIVNWQSMTGYVATVSSGLTTNDSPTMAAGTDWTFALASVTNTASSGTEIVNYQTMTNYVALNVVWVASPAATNSAGTAGMAAYSDNYLYICVSNATWRRSTLSAW
jgi:hypothetical protein